MTTIATDGRSIAADGLVTSNGLIHGFDEVKLFRAKNGAIVGCCGSVYYAPSFMRWFDGEDPNLAELGESFEAIVLMPDGTCRSYDEKGRFAAQSTPAVSGSGGAIALGAMLAGADPATAVTIAGERDTLTGGTVLCYELGEA